MKIKMNDIKRPTGIPNARVAPSPGKDDDGIPFVLTHISAEDIFGIPTVVGSLRMTPTEAREFATRLTVAAYNADKL